MKGLVMWGCNFNGDIPFLGYFLSHGIFSLLFWCVVFVHDIMEIAIAQTTVAFAYLFWFDRTKCSISPSRISCILPAMLWMIRPFCQIAHYRSVLRIHPKARPESLHQLASTRQRAFPDSSASLKGIINLAQQWDLILAHNPIQ